MIVESCLTLQKTRQGGVLNEKTNWPIWKVGNMFFFTVFTLPVRPTALSNISHMPFQWSPSYCCSDLYFFLVQKPCINEGKLFAGENSLAGRIKPCHSCSLYSRDLCPSKCTLMKGNILYLGNQQAERVWHRVLGNSGHQVWAMVSIFFKKVVAQIGTHLKYQSISIWICFKWNYG